MRVVITSNYELNNETGSAKVAYDLANKLSEKNSVLLICLGKKQEITNHNNLIIFKIPSIVVNNIYFPIISPLTMYQVYKFLDDFKPDIVHTQNSILISKLVQNWSVSKKVPLIVTFHHIPTEPITHLFPDSKKNILSDLVQEVYRNTSLKNFLNNTDCVIAQNKIIYESVKTISKKVKVRIINNGIEITTLNKIKPRKNDGKINFVFLGSYMERKNQLYLLKVFKYLPKNYCLNLYGKTSSNNSYLKKISEYHQKYKLDNIKIKDFKKNIVSIFNKTDFLVSASKKEAQSLVIMQSLAAGKPIIGLENETISELVNSKNGLVVNKKTTPKIFASKLINFIKKKNYTYLSKNCIKNSSKFDINLVVSKMYKCYESLTNPNRHQS